MQRRVARTRRGRRTEEEEEGGLLLLLPGPGLFDGVNAEDDMGEARAAGTEEDLESMLDEVLKEMRIFGFNCFMTNRLGLVII